MHGRRTLAAALAVLAVAGCARSESLPAPPTSAPALPGTGVRPSVIMILADDLDVATYADRDRFPVFHQEMVQRGTTLTNFFVTDSLCCPSRASILRGQYTHNTGIRSNVPPAGGFEKFRAEGLEQSTLATWLDGAGYHTGLIGKYLNGYPEAGAETYVPPGWDQWVSPVRGDPYTQYDYTLNDNGELRQYGNTETDYLGDVMNTETFDFVRTAPPDRPFFLYVAPFVPHDPAEPAARYAEAFPDAELPRPPSFDQEDLSAEPDWFRRRRPLLASEIRSAETLYRLRLQSMLSIEDLLRGVFDTLAETGRDRDTYVIVTSDNGFHLGEHRLRPGKETAYEEDIRVPFTVRGPGIRAGERIGDLTSAIDVAPTIAALTDTPVPDFVDGGSVADRLRGAPPGPDTRRNVLIEHLSRNADPQTGLDPAFDPDEPPRTPGENPRDEPRTSRSNRRAFVSPPTYEAVRTEQYLWVEYVTGERQLYDLRADPFQLRNLAAVASSTLVLDLAAQLAALRTCAAETCRATSARR